MSEIPVQPSLELASESRPTPLAIRLDDVSVCYRVPRERIYSFKHYALRRLKRSISFDTLWALREVGFDVCRGEVFGIIGANGAGKSTLLKVVARVLRPTSGRVRVFGRVAPLLELGAGFDHELTGRENVYLNGAILGYRKADLEARFERIVQFAGLDRFIDAPLRTYSSGMVARLGFAVATDAVPEVLIVDEVLAVGDAEFQRKSSERMAQIQQRGTTILVVSHDLGAIRRICTRVAWLEHGRLRLIGPTEQVVSEYEVSAA